jgi:serine/threonine-protein kinase
MGGLILVAYMADLLLEVFTDLVERPITTYILAVPLVVVSAAVAWICRKGKLPPRRFPALAVTYEVLFAWAITASDQLGWQTAVGEGGLYGIWGFPSVALWVVVFSAVVPLSPRLHLLGSLLSVLAIPVFLYLSLSLSDAAPVRPALISKVLTQLMAPALFAVAFAYYAARVVFGLARELSSARQMGTYRLTQQLGKGGMGEVWRAEHEMLARPAAIKLIRGDLAGTVDPSSSKPYLQRFQREVQATANLRSPHTIEVYDYGISDDGTFYYVMELFVRKHGPLPAARVTHTLRQACHSLGEAHQHGLVHRDIKPANIFLCRHGRDVDVVKILDFGLVKEIETTNDVTQLGLTQAGVFVGTPACAAPETVSGQMEEVGPKSDIYSLGCVAFWLLTGRNVFEAQSTMQMLVKHIKEPPAPPSKFAEEDVPPDLDRILLDCLEKDPEQRVASADELDQRLAAVQQSVPWPADRARRWWELQRP